MCICSITGCALVKRLKKKIHRMWHKWSIHISMNTIFYSAFKHLFYVSTKTVTCNKISCYEIYNYNEEFTKKLIRLKRIGWFNESFCFVSDKGMTEVGVVRGSPDSDCNSNHHGSASYLSNTSSQDNDFIQDNSDYQWFLDYGFVFKTI